MNRRIALPGILWLCVAGPAHAQLTRVSPDLAVKRPGWLPRYVTTPMEGASGLTLAHVAAARQTLEKIQRILMQIPELGQPKGFEVMPQFRGGARIRGLNDGEMPGTIVEYGLFLFFFAPTQAIAGEGCTCIQVVVNRAGLPAPFFDEQGRPFNIEQTRAKPMQHATYVYIDELSKWRPVGLDPDPEEQSYVQVVLTSAGELPWRPVTREEYYKSQIFQVEGKGGATREQIRKGTEQTPYERWLAEGPKRKAEREQALRNAAQVQSAAQIAALRKSLEDTEREVEASLKASDGEQRENLQSDFHAYLANLDSMRAELARMSPAERNMIAVIDRSASPAGPSATGRYMAGRDDLATTWRVLTPNFDFWRPRRSPVEVRSIHVSIIASGTGLVPAVRHALGEAFKKMDWAALNALLDEPRR